MISHIQEETYPKAVREYGAEIYGPTTACDMYGKRWKCIQGSDWKNLREGGYSEDVGIDRRINY